MKLYVVNPNTKKKVYLNLIASTRHGLANQIDGENFYLGDNLYSVSDVCAEYESNNTATGVVVGGAVGALYGPVGIIIGGLLGGLIGNSSDVKEIVRVRRFNNS
jgi:hypothetical protein